uniref:odorant receptor 131-2-like n=1 Tax=Centroberyx gerrardi TaxID=166262 RepID=UPI003AB070A4
MFRVYTRVSFQAVVPGTPPKGGEGGHPYQMQSVSMSIQSWKNSSTSQQYEVELVKGLYGFLSVSPCLIFLYINSIMLFTLRSKPVFTETPRYILLFSLLFADTVQLALGQLLYILATARVYMVHYVCLIIIMVTALTTDISPLNLAVMSLERYVAVCFPLRHASIVTIRSTIAVIAAIWAVCLVNILLRLLMLLFLDATPFHRFMQDFCVKNALFHLKIFHDFEKGFMCMVFVSVGTVIVCSYIGVIVTARSASSDKASASKARKTVLLHLIQLGLTLASTLHTTIFTALHGRVDRVTIVRIHYVLFFCLFCSPRCLSCLIYGLRDQTIRPVLMYHLSFCLRFLGIVASAWFAQTEAQFALREITADATRYFYVVSALGSAQRSVLPALGVDILAGGHGPSMVAANGSPIRTYDMRYVALCFGGQRFGWDFVTAKGGTPHRHHRPPVYARARRLDPAKLAIART